MAYTRLKMTALSTGTLLLGYVTGLVHAADTIANNTAGMTLLDARLANVDVLPPTIAGLVALALFVLLVVGDRS